VAAHVVGDPGAVVAAIQALVAFCLAASSAYLLNDLSDLAADRAHPRKRSRPLASGRLSIPAGFLLAGLCLAGAFGMALLLPPMFAAALAAYYALTVMYSWLLRSEALVDVLTLAALYTLRIVAGAHAIGVPLSFWLLGFSMFVFFSLALVKRYAELAALRESGLGEAPGRGYSAGDAPIVLAVGVGSAMVSALVLALYMNSDSVKLLYARPDVLWLTCPLFLYWICRVWLLASRGEMNEDPVLFAVRDVPSYAVVAIALVLVWLAT
jgi:4-hydroxybenzoate polyprenyltransferase